MPRHASSAPRPSGVGSVKVFGLDIRPFERGARLDLDRLDAEITERAEAAFSFLERLVAAPSTVGDEDEAQVMVEHELKRLGFTYVALDLQGFRSGSLNEPLRS